MAQTRIPTPPNGMPPSAGMHPFDSAFGIMKSMQAQLGELRSALQQEQTQRVKDVSQLKSEVRDLHDQLSRMKVEHTSTYQRVTCAITSETALRGRSLQQLRDDLDKVGEDAKQVHPLKDKVGFQHIQLDNALKTERRERETAERDLYEKLEAEVCLRTDQFDQASTEIGNLRYTSETNTVQDRDFLSNVAQNMQLAGELLAGAAGSRLGLDATETGGLSDTIANMEKMVLETSGKGYIPDGPSGTSPTSMGSTMMTSPSPNRFDNTSPLRDEP